MVWANFGHIILYKKRVVDNRHKYIKNIYEFKESWHLNYNLSEDIGAFHEYEIKFYIIYLFINSYYFFISIVIDLFFFFIFTLSCYIYYFSRDANKFD